MTEFSDVLTALKPIWGQAKAVYKPLSDAASFIASTGFVTYFINQYKKKRQMPELACNMLIEGVTVFPQGEAISDGRGGLFVSGNKSKVQQKCVFTLSNVSEYVALKLSIRNKEHVTWDFPLDSTKVLKAYDEIQLIIYPSVIVNNDAIALLNKDTIILINELIIEYRNVSGKKYNLVFKPNEKDIDKRNVCKKAS